MDSENTNDLSTLSMHFKHAKGILLRIHACLQRRIISIKNSFPVLDNFRFICYKVFIGLMAEFPN